jgi:hypothetical protein
MPIFGERDAAHRPPRGEMRFSFAQPATAMLVFEQRQMRRDFAIEILIHALVAQKAAQPQEESSHSNRHSAA